MAKKTTTVVSVDFSKKIGPIHAMHGVGQPPLMWMVDYSLFPYLKEAGVPYSRLHDVGGPFGQNILVDIPNLFKNFDANPYDPANYDFTFTDGLMKALVENGIEPYFRLGINIENYVTIKPYRVFPPKDNLQWARICEGVIRHYTEGWANGFNMKVSHWEIWNEPDNQPDPLKNQMWRGTFEQYMELYKTASCYLKKLFPHLMIGGYAGCGLYIVTSDENTSQEMIERWTYLQKCFLDFLAFCKENNCPLDFFSCHCYHSTAEMAYKQVRYVREKLNDFGFAKTEVSINEWYCYSFDDGKLDTAFQSSQMAAMMLAMQNSGAVNDAEIYDARCGIGLYSPLFNPATFQPRKPYYSLKAFNELYKRKNAVAVSETPAGIWATAAKGPKDGAVMIANTNEKPQKLTLDFGGKKATSCILIDATHVYDEVDLPAELPAESVLVVFVK